MKYNVMAVVWLMACLCTADITLGSDALNIEDIDEPSPSKRKKSTRKTPKDEVLKEIERGVYLKAGGGSFVAITGLRTAFRPGNSGSLALGFDWIDKPKSTVSTQVQWSQAIHRMRTDTPESTVQGSSISLTALASIQYSAHLTRRFALGVRAGGGVVTLPKLTTSAIDPTEPVGQWNNRAFAAVLAGPTVEYYTKLNHFSVGIDADFRWVAGLDTGVQTTGYFKYTF